MCSRSLPRLLQGLSRSLEGNIRPMISCAVFGRREFRSDFSVTGGRTLRIWASNANKKNVEDDKLRGQQEKVLNVKLKAQRLDAVLKAGLALSRNKIEKAIYEDRVRVNGERPTKKSQVIYEGDEVDIVRGYNDLNPDNFIDVSRVEIVTLKDPEDEGSSGDESDGEEDGRIPAVLRRSKLLTIKNYARPWKGSKHD